LAHVLEPMVNDETEINVLEIAHHVDPNKLRSRLLEEVALMEETMTRTSFWDMGFADAPWKGLYPAAAH
jgi:hypothetical protein